MFELDNFADSHPKSGVTAGAVSLSLHTAAIVILWLLFLFSQGGTIPKPQAPAPHISLALPHALLYSVPNTGGGGGGGEHAVMPPSRGNPPPSSPVKTFVAPTPVTNVTPKLAVQPTLLDAEAPRIDSNQYGDPNSQIAALSLGMGDHGIGTHGSGGLGPGEGPGYKDGKGGHRGGNVYVPGNGVSFPTLIYKVEPEYSEQARQSKYSGSVLLRVIVDENGIPVNISVIRPLGLGLDEKAIEAVKHWRFQPGKKDGRPVAVEATIQVNFRLL